MTREFTEWDTRNFFKALKVMLDNLPPKDVAAMELGMLAVIRQDIAVETVEIIGDEVHFRHIIGGRLDRHAT